MLIPFSSASSETVPVTLASRSSDPPALVRNLSGSRKLETPTCWIGTCEPWIASCAASIMSGSDAR
jgi:hypothetical protein